MTKKEKEAQIAECARYMAAHYPQGTPLKGYVVSRDNRTGTRRVAIFGAYIDDNELPRVQNLSHHAAILCGYRLNRDGEVIVPGCGFSATFELISGMGQAVYGNASAYPED